jgi:hypothetical protein
VAPYELLDDNGNISAVAVAWVESFGSENGSVVAGLRSHQHAVQSAARRQGQFCSFINEGSSAQYDRELFVATLNDWRWYGDPAHAPAWHTGKPWTE